MKLIQIIYDMPDLGDTAQQKSLTKYKEKLIWNTGWQSRVKHSSD